MSGPGGSATGSSTSARPPSCTTWPTGPPSGSPTSPPISSPSGAVTNIVPDPSPDAPLWKDGHGASGWGDAAVHVPWELYRATGRTDVLADAVRLDAPLGRLRRRHAPLRAATRRGSSATREPLPHERYLWDTGWHFGEWLEPGTNMDDGLRRPVRRRPRPRRHRLPLPVRGPAGAHRPRSWATPRSPSATARSPRTCSTPGASSSSTTHGHVQPQTQANLVRALAFGLVPDDLRDAGGDRPRRAHPRRGHPPRHRLPGHPVPAPGPGRHRPPRRRLRAAPPGHEPSWLHMTDVGATTMWEDWDGVRADGTAVALAQPLQQGRGHLLPAPLRRRPRTDRARLPARSGSPPHPVAASPGRRATTTRPTGASTSPGPPTPPAPGSSTSPCPPAPRPTCASPTAPPTCSARDPTSAPGPSCELPPTTSRRCRPHATEWAGVRGRDPCGAGRDRVVRHRAQRRLA